MAQPKQATKKAAAAPQGDKPKRTRTVLSPAERIAKLEADLAAARARVEQKDVKAASKLKADKAKLVGKRDELDKKIADIDEQLQLLGNVGEDELPMAEDPIVSVTGEDQSAVSNA